MIDYEKIGKRIVEQRKHLRKISQEKMAEDLMMYQPDISNMEKGRLGSGIDNLEKLDRIAEYFGVPLQELIFGKTSQSAIIPYGKDSKNIASFEDFGKNIKSVNTTHNQILRTLFGADPERLELASYKYKNYTAYVSEECQQIFGNALVLPIERIYVFYNDEIIANSKVAVTSISQYINRDNMKTIQDMIPNDVLDVDDVYMLINPYYVFRTFPNNKGTEEFEHKFLARNDELGKKGKENILLIESVYVLEDYRRNNIFRFMLDILNCRYKDYSAWLNLEPTFGDELTAETGDFPVFDIAGVGQLSTNAAIAERLGFTVDPDVQLREAETVDRAGAVTTKVIEIRKCAYRLSPFLESVTANDGNLVALGRAKQTIAEEKETVNEDAYIDVFNEKVKDVWLTEIKYKKVSGKVLYFFAGMLIRGGEKIMSYNVSKRSAIKNKLQVSALESYDSLDAAKESPYYEELKMLAGFYNAQYANRILSQEELPKIPENVKKVNIQS